MRAYKTTKPIKTMLIGFLIANSLQTASFAAEPSSQEEEKSRKIYLIEKYDFNPDYKSGVVRALMDYFTNYGGYPDTLEGLVKYMQEKARCDMDIRIDDPFANSETNGAKEAKERQFGYTKTDINKCCVWSRGPNGRYDKLEGDDIVYCLDRNEKATIESFQERGQKQSKGE